MHWVYFSKQENSGITRNFTACFTEEMKCLFLDRSNCILSLCIQFHYSLVVFIGYKHVTYQVNRIAALDGQFASACKCLIGYVLMKNLLSHSIYCRMGWRCHGNASGRSCSPAGISLLFCIFSMPPIKRSVMHQVNWESLFCGFSWIIVGKGMEHNVSVIAEKSYKCQFALFEYTGWYCLKYVFSCTLQF